MNYSFKNLNSQEKDREKSDVIKKWFSLTKYSNRSQDKQKQMRSEFGIKLNFGKEFQLLISWNFS